MAATARSAMRKKPVTHWTIEELNKVVARHFCSTGGITAFLKRDTHWN
jgi:hypothetical protein